MIEYNYCKFGAIKVVGPGRVRAASARPEEILPKSCIIVYIRIFFLDVLNQILGFKSNFEYIPLLEGDLKAKSAGQTEFSAKVYSCTSFVWKAECTGWKL